MNTNMEELITQKIIATPYRLNEAQFELEKKAFYSIVCTIIGERPKLTNEIAKIWSNLILWTYASPASVFKPDKGFCFSGKAGTTKTLTLLTFKAYLAQKQAKYKRGEHEIPKSFQLIQATQLNEAYEKKGLDGLYKFSRLYANLGIDDVGVESIPAKYYGDPLNVFEYVFNERANLNRLTHFTTNFNKDELIQAYDDKFKRTSSRLAATTNVIEIQNELDFRGNIDVYKFK